MTCPACGDSTSAAESKFCEACGAPLASGNVHLPGDYRPGALCNAPHKVPL